MRANDTDVDQHMLNLWITMTHFTPISSLILIYIYYSCHIQISSEQGQYLGEEMNVCALTRAYGTMFIHFDVHP